MREKILNLPTLTEVRSCETSLEIWMSENYWPTLGVPVSQLMTFPERDF